jgi:membrane-associated phospholipid phosphatase
LVGFSRVPLQAHYPSDVFAGAVLGYTIAHYVVLKPQ